MTTYYNSTASLPSIDTKYNPSLFIREYNQNLGALKFILNEQHPGWGTRVTKSINNLEFGTSDIKQAIADFIPTDRISKDCIKSLLVDCVVDAKKVFQLQLKN